MIFRRSRDAATGAPRRLGTLLLVLTIGLTGCATFGSPAAVSVCEVNERPSKFADREVLLEAQVSGDPAGMRFVDRRCPGQSLAARMSDPEAWNELLVAIVDDSRERIVDGRFVGVLRPEGNTASFELRTVVDLQSRR